MHHAAWVIAPLLAVVVLVWSGVAKFGSGGSLRSIIANLRLPAWLLPSPLARAIPGMELALAAGLLMPWLPVFAVAAAGCLLLMVAYWALIARGMTITPRPTCGCFGQAGDHQISWRTLLRNTILVAAAGATVTLASTGRTAWSLLGDFGSGDVLWLGLTALACVVTGLVLAGPAKAGSGSGAPAATSDLAEPAEDDDYVRQPIPAALLHAPGTGPVTLLELATARAQLLVFVNCYCASTSDTAREVDGWQERLALVDVHLVFSVPIPHESTIPVPEGTLLDHAGLAWQALGLTSSPSAVLLGADGHLAGGPVSGVGEIKDFVDDIVDTLREASVDVDEDPLDELVMEAAQLTGDR